MLDPQAFRFLPDGAVPNQPRLPALLYRAVFDAQEPDLAGLIEAVFASHGWQPQWRQDMFDDQHHHSTAHEALGVARGWARVQLGGEHGETVALCAGDALVLPAGTGHRKLDGSDDFEMVGADPEGQDWDVVRADPHKSAAARARIEAVPLPRIDPVAGPEGPLLRLWHD
jgi:uncharacterized protein YjlB